MTIGEAIKAERMRQGLSQEKLADMCGLHVRTIRSCEKGARKTHRDKIEIVLKALGMNYEEGGEDDE